MTLLKTYTKTQCYWKVVRVVTNKTHFWICISVLLIINVLLVSTIKWMISISKWLVILFHKAMLGCSMLGYSTHYSQLIRFFHRLCNNINDFLFQAKFSYSKLVKRGYKHSLLLKYFKRFCSAYNIEGNYGEKSSDLLFSRMVIHNHFVSCNI